MAAAVPDDRKELAEAVAAFNVQPKHPKHKKSAAMGGKGQGNLCDVHKKYFYRRYLKRLPASHGEVQVLFIIQE